MEPSWASMGSVGIHGPHGAHDKGAHGAHPMGPWAWARPRPFLIDELTSKKRVLEKMHVPSQTNTTDPMIFWLIWSRLLESFKVMNR